MRAQFASGTLTDLQRVNLLEELLQVSSGCTDTEGPAGRAAGWRAPCPWHGSRGPVGCRAPRCQRLSSPLPQAHERAVEKRKAEARESLMKVSRCPLVWVCSSSMEEAGGECGMELLSDGAS